MIDYFTQLGKVYLSEHASDEALMGVGGGVPPMEDKPDEKVDSPVETSAKPAKRENTERHDSVSIKTPVMPVRTEVHQVQPPGVRRSHTTAPFDHLAVLIMASKRQENDIGNSSKRITVKGHTGGSRNMWQGFGGAEASIEKPKAQRIHPAEIPVTVFGIEIRPA